MYHYVYRITNKKLNKHYYGKRSSKVQPEEDLGIRYFSSSRDREFKETQQVRPWEFKYKVVKVFDSSESALAYEVFLHSKFNVAKHQSFYNKANQTSKGFTTFGVSPSEEAREKMSKVRKGRIFSDLHKKRIGDANKGRKVIEKTRNALSLANTGYVIVKDVLGSTLRVPTTDKRYLSGELVSINVGKKASKETKQKMISKRVKNANIYCYYTDKLLVKNVVIAYWGKENGYSPGTLSATARADRDKPSNKYNPHHHKGVYVKYNK